MLARRHAPVGGFLLLTVAGCQLVGGFEEPVEVEAEPSCASLPARKIDEARNAWVVRIDDGNGGCFWMDETEVTVAQYRSFLERLPGFNQWDERCLWKPVGASNPMGDPNDVCRDTIPDGEAGPFQENKPARCVDWCDAEAFCRTAGSGQAHLCYRHNTGGAIEPGPGSSAEWETGCGASRSPYPWGDAPGDAECNVAPCTTLYCGATPVGDLPSCRSPEGLVDVLGNVREWVFSCAAENSTLQETHCSTLGGSYENELRTCNGAPISEPKSTRRADLGFRCCADLTLEEEAAAGR